MPKFENWSMVEEATEWKNDLTGDRVLILRPNRSVSRTDTEWRVFLEGPNATERVPYPDVKDRMGIGRGQSQPERGLITKLPRLQDAVEDARNWMDQNPLAGIVPLVIEEAEENSHRFEDSHADIEDESWNVVEEVLYHDLGFSQDEVPPKLETKLVNEVKEIWI
jgi:hypothetical protein